MYVTYFYNGQGLGNQLWSYVVTRCLAKNKGVNFAILCSENFKGTKFFQLDFGLEINHKKFTSPNDLLPNSIKNYYLEPTLWHYEEQCDVRDTDSALLSLPDFTKIDGYFQSESYIEKYKVDIKNWLRVSPVEDLNFLKNNNICLINVRGGIYKSNKRLILHKNYWRNAITIMKEKRKIEKFIVISDDYKYAKTLFPEFETLNQTVEKDYYALTICKNVILSNSSFAFFPIYCNSQKPFILAPKYWARHNVSDGYWACGFNIYKNWNYVDRKGVVSNSQACKREWNNYLKSSQSIQKLNAAPVQKRSTRLFQFFKNRFVKYE